MDGERNHSMGSPMDGTPYSAVITLTIHHDQQLHAAIVRYIPQETLSTQANTWFAVAAGTFNRTTAQT